MIEKENQSLLEFKDTNIRGTVLSGEYLKANLKEKDFLRVPVKLKVGKVKYRIGAIQKARKGREEVFGDIVFELEGELKLNILRDGKKVIGVEPEEFLFEQSNPSFGE